MEQLVICITPEKEIFDEISNLMKEVSNKLDSKKALIFPPHITLIGRFKTEKYLNLKNKIKKINEGLSPFEIELTGLEYFEKPEIVFLKPKDLSKLKILHNKLLEIVNDFREPWIRDAFLNGNFNDKQKKYIEIYGSPFVKEFYNSHLTLSGPDVNSEKFQELIKKSKKYSFKFKVNKINILKRNGDDWFLEEI